jgi:hypothetical protein
MGLFDCKKTAIESKAKRWHDHAIQRKTGPAAYFPLIADVLFVEKVQMTVDLVRIFAISGKFPGTGKAMTA